jgi:hypothetical protein
MERHCCARMCVVVVFGASLERSRLGRVRFSLLPPPHSIPPPLSPFLLPLTLCPH